MKFLKCLLNLRQSRDGSIPGWFSWCRVSGVGCRVQVSCVKCCVLRINPSDGSIPGWFNIPHVSDVIFWGTHPTPPTPHYTHYISLYPYTPIYTFTPTCPTSQFSPTLHISPYTPFNSLLPLHTDKISPPYLPFNPYTSYSSTPPTTLYSLQLATPPTHRQDSTTISTVQPLNLFTLHPYTHYISLNPPTALSSLQLYPFTPYKPTLPSSPYCPTHRHRKHHHLLFLKQRRSPDQSLRNHEFFHWINSFQLSQVLPQEQEIRRLCQGNLY